MEIAQLKLSAPANKSRKALTLALLAYFQGASTLPEKKTEADIPNKDRRLSANFNFGTYKGGSSAPLLNDYWDDRALAALASFTDCQSFSSLVKWWS
jgi:hypothetical protein